MVCRSIFWKPSVALCPSLAAFVLNLAYRQNCSDVVVGLEGFVCEKEHLDFFDFPKLECV